MLKNKKELFFMLSVYTLSTAAWLASNIHAPLRYTMEPLKVTEWHFFSAGINALILLVLVFLKRKELFFIPIFYAIQPLAYIIMSFISPQILGNHPNQMTWKFVNDILFFILEIVLFLPLLLMLRTGDRMPFKALRKKEPGKNKEVILPMWKKGRKWTVSFLYAATVLVLCFLTVYSPIQQEIRLDLIVQLLGFQIVFALFLGIKEELIFRWIFLKGNEKIFQSRLAALFLQAVPWALYHAFFGEGTGTGLIGGGLTLFGALCFGFLVYETESLLLPLILHILIEAFGFYLMYGVLIARFY
jgi:membrane protease YdiL (CAAX protease family)